jgi:hypothetical protein
MMFFCYDHIHFRYEPFPIALARPIMADSTYATFLDNFPAIDIFESFEKMGKIGRKFTLSEKENSKTYSDFVQSRPVWREFHAWIKSDDFAYGALEMLKGHHIDLGFEHVDPTKRMAKRVKTALTGRVSPREVPLKARFEFSALPADGGWVQPHTDAPSKIVTMVISMAKEGEWNPAWGGGTDVNRPKSTDLAYNQMNALAEFEDMEVLQTYEFTPNQAVIFVKTFNSWHSVRPMSGVAGMLRRTLTVVIETMR